MSSSFDQIPDSISFGDLEKLQAEASKEADVKPAPRFGGCTQEVIEDLVAQKLSEISEKCEHPVAHKVAMMMILDNMLEWHTRVSRSLIEDGDACHAIGWARDAGKFQAIANILDTISVSDDDFTCEQ